MADRPVVTPDDAEAMAFAKARYEAELETEARTKAAAKAKSKAEKKAKAEAKARANAEARAGGSKRFRHQTGFGKTWMITRWTWTLLAFVPGLVAKAWRIAWQLGLVVLAIVVLVGGYYGYGAYQKVASVFGPKVATTVAESVWDKAWNWVKPVPKPTPPPPPAPAPVQPAPTPKPAPAPAASPVARTAPPATPAAPVKTAPVPVSPAPAPVPNPKECKVEGTVFVKEFGRCAFPD